MPNLDDRSINIRKHILEIFAIGQESGVGGHLGGAFSLVEILRVIYDDFAKHKVTNPNWELRDRIILSKGHGCLALYAILYDKGYLSKKQFLSYGKKNTILSGHPEHFINGVEASTGSLGHGLPIGVGMALASKIKKRKNKVIVIVGDGELNEGSNWEAAMTASKHSLKNLIVLVDYNKYQSYGKIEEVSGLYPLKDKFQSFGFQTQEIDGHNIKQIKKALNKTLKLKNKPSAIICHTIKGKGYKEAENNPDWHYKKNVNLEEIKKIYSRLK